MADDDLTSRILDLHDDAQRPLTHGLVQTVLRGFHEGRASEEFADRWIGFWRDAGAVVRGVWDAPAAVGSDERPVATFVSWGGEINVGAGRMLPAHLVSDVGVSPTHRRRGLMRRLMAEDLDHAAAEHRPIAILTASEGSIYGRFGFGVATRSRHVEVDTSTGFALRDDAVVAGGRLVLVDPVEAGEVTETVFDRFHRATRGSVARPGFYHWFTHENLEFESRARDPKSHTCVHLDDDGVPQGYVTYRHEGELHGRSTLRIRDLTAATTGSYLRLWRFLADVDLAEQVTWIRGPVVDPLSWALADHRRVSTVREADMLWLRVLDVEAALGARPWGADGAVVLDVDDALGHAAGRWRVETAGGEARVTRTDATASLALDAETLGALYLGGVDARTLADVGRLRGEPAAVDTWAAMADVGPLPYCTTGF